MCNNCKIIEKRIVKTEIRLFEEEIDIVDFLCFYYDLSYEQLLVSLASEKIGKLPFVNKKVEAI